MRRLAPTVAAAVLVVALPVACTTSKGSKAAYCSQLKHTPALADVLSGFGTDDPRTLTKKLDTVTRQFRDLEHAAPREVRSDTSEVADLVTAIAQVVKDNAGNPTVIPARLRTLAVSRTGAAKAAQGIATYAKQQCNISLNPTDPPTAPTTGGPATTGAPTTG